MNTEEIVLCALWILCSAFFNKNLFENLFIIMKVKIAFDYRHIGKKEV